ncbi:MAG: SIMPL domain-containing protein [Selenomonadaceae bacterium]|nr:SIMPL domain-containing protein [Selenomonadaceae bacterium]
MYRKLISAMAVLCYCLLPLTVHAEEATAQSVISVHGEGMAEATPDMATITLGIVTESKDGAAAQKENAIVAQKIRGSLYEMGISEKDIQTNNFSFQPQHDYNRTDSSNRLIGYRVENSLVVRLSDISRSGEVIDRSLKAGANQVNSLNFGIKDTKALRSRALTAAVTDARERAEVIAKALGVQIHGVKLVSESTSRPYAAARNFDGLAMAKAEGINVSTPIESGEVSISATVQIEFFVE